MNSLQTVEQSSSLICFGVLSLGCKCFPELSVPKTEVSGSHSSLLTSDLSSISPFRETYIEVTVQNLLHAMVFFLCSWVNITKSTGISSSLKDCPKRSVHSGFLLYRYIQKDQILYSLQISEVISLKLSAYAYLICLVSSAQMCTRSLILRMVRQFENPCNST